MKLILITLAGLLIMGFVRDSRAQYLDEIPNLSCPRFELFASTFTATEGDTVTFTASLTGGNVDLTDLKYRWHVSPGVRIEPSQGSPVATLDTSTVKGSWAIVTLEVGPFQMCPQVASQQVAIRRKGPYTRTDDFWWWFQLHEKDLRSYEMPEYSRWVKELTERLREVDERLTFRINHEEKDLTKVRFVIGFRGKPYDAKVVDAFLARAPDSTGFEFVSATVHP